MLEAVTDDFTTVGDHDKGTWLNLSNLITKHNRLTAANYCKDNGTLGMIMRTGSLVVSSSVMQFLLNVIHNRYRIAGNNGKVLAPVGTFDDGVDYHGFAHQTCKGEKTCLDVEDEAGCNRDNKVHPEKCDADREAAVLLDDHGQDIGTTAAGFHIKEKRGGKSRQYDSKNQFQDRLVGQRCTHGMELLQQANAN